MIWRQYIKQRKAQLAALGQWTHVNCLKRDARDRVQDEILADLLYTHEVQQKPASPKQSRLDTFLEAVDLENVLTADAPPLTVDRVPGGTVCFLFERSSKSILEDIEKSGDDEE